VGNRGGRGWYSGDVSKDWREVALADAGLFNAEVLMLSLSSSSGMASISTNAFAMLVAAKNVYLQPALRAKISPTRHGTRQPSRTQAAG
jgi:hypothetical protein